MRLTCIFLALMPGLRAAETAVLVDGTRIVTRARENAGPAIRLYTASGVKEVPADSIDHFEEGIVLGEPPPLRLAAPAGLPGWVTLTAPRKPLNAWGLIQEAARRYGVPALMMRSIMAAESGFDPDAISRRGAIGLMQLMPATARQFGMNPHIPEENVKAGARYLRFLIEKYRKFKDWIRRVIAAYNAGPAAVDRYRGVPPYRETRIYVARVMAWLRLYRE